MFTKNYQRLRERLFRGGTNSQKLTSLNGKTYDIGSSYSYFRYLDIGYYMSRIVTSHTTTDTLSTGYEYSARNCGVAFGSGTTEPTIDDIDLENKITSGYSVTCGGLNLGKVTDGHYCAWASYTITNTSKTEMSISEIGVFTNYVTGGQAYPILMERTVLDEPVIIAPNDQKIITYKINFYH